MENLLGLFLSSAPKNKKQALAQEVLKDFVQTYVRTTLPVLCDPEDLSAYIRSFLNPADYQQEVFGYVSFDIRQQPISIGIVARGAQDTVSLSIAGLLREVLTSGKRVPVRFMVFHTHPAGKSNPSEADIVLTERLKEAGLLVGLTLIEHIILAAGEFTPLAGRYF
jgi:DNA repair protein RadC